MIAGDRNGVIVNISSISRAGNFGQSNYAAAKAGVAAVTVTWAKELARHGIRVASISPGFTATELVAAMPEKAIERITGEIPLGRLAEPAEIAQAVRFIFENDYFSGRDLEIDGALRL
jgi:3-oxoacyl-[acyl-carrier protein] reductase